MASAPNFENAFIVTLTAYLRMCSRNANENAQRCAAGGRTNVTKTRPAHSLQQKLENIINHSMLILNLPLTLRLPNLRMRLVIAVPVVRGSWRI